MLSVPGCHKIPGEAGGISGGPHTQVTLKIKDFLETGLLNHGVTHPWSQVLLHGGAGRATSRAASTHSGRSSVSPTRLWPPKSSRRQLVKGPNAPRGAKLPRLKSTDVREHPSDTCYLQKREIQQLSHEHLILLEAVISPDSSMVRAIKPWERKMGQVIVVEAIRKPRGLDPLRLGETQEPRRPTAVSGLWRGRGGTKQKGDGGWRPQPLAECAPER